MNRPTVFQLAILEPPEMQAQLENLYEVVSDIDAASHAEIVVTAGNVGLSGAQMTALPALKLIAVNGVGVDAVDLHEAARRGIAVTTPPTFCPLRLQRWRWHWRWMRAVACPKATALSAVADGSAKASWALVDRC